MASSRTLVLAAAIAVLVLGNASLTTSGTNLIAPAFAQGSSAPRAKLMHIRVPVNKSQALRLEYAFTDVLVGSAEIADVIPLSDQSLYILGKKTGTTNISVLDDSKRIIGVIDVEIGPDTGSVAEKLAAGAGSSGIRVRSSGDQLILEGTAADAPTVDRAVEIARANSPGGVINATRVASPQQVMLKVRFVEVNRGAGREFGIRYDYRGKTRAASVGHGGPVQDSSGSGGSGSGQGAGLILDSLLGSAAPFATILARFANNSRMLDLTIDALESKGLVRRLAEPNLVAMSGDSAEFRAGGEIPIPIATTTSGGVPTITVTYKEFGVKLNFTPTVLSNGLINLKLEPEVSDIDPTVSVKTGGIEIPGLTVRRAKTTVELRDGQSFALAGLLQNVTERNIEQFPWLGSLPVLGALFRSTEFISRETELVVIVTPHLVKPARPGDRIATPLDSTLPANDLDLFLVGQTEVAKPRDPSTASPAQQWISANGTVIAGPYGHILEPDAPAPAVQRVNVKKPPARAAVPVSVKN
ncbi:type II and III secretion system protein family protein [Microvirga terricola]|uniref:Type II and III secretion system protein family protein n=1 Tax=Microvirga terricola TaxID=2719797 RepID=A0ABX0VI17_9HYPH|nr:type II and III secretion system protein family protein [Microvirga terricola]NIX78376.1 type II and III secretion system protein family protein [Microvirga terricola]